MGIFGSEVKWKTGFVEVDEKNGDDLFYWLIRSQHSPSTDPLVLWLNGGPGCSSEIGLFYEVGPWRFKGGGQDGEGGNEVTLEKNPFSWSNIANMLFVDNPLGAGFSTGNELYSDSLDELAFLLEIFLTRFLDQNPDFNGRKFHIVGESWAGKYVPALAHRLLFNSQKPVKLDLKGIAIGNGIVDPYHQST